MADQNLTVRITTDAGQAITSTQDLETRLAALEQAFVRQQGATTRATAATHEHAAAQQRSTVESRVAAEAAMGLGGALDALATHYRMVSAGAESLGLETSGAAARVAAFGEVIEGLEATMAPLLIALAAMEVAFKGFEFIKEGIDGAAKLQDQMETLGAAVEAQGGNWESAREDIESFVKSESLASGFTESELVPALNKLVTSGNDIHDSMAIAAVAEELARAKHISLAEATDALIQAEAGRATGLVRLDTHLKDVIKSHGKMSEVLAIVHQDMGNAITNSHSYEMQTARLHVMIEALAEEIGKAFLPMLTAIATTMIGALKNAEDFGHGFIQAFNGVVAAIKNTASAVGHFATGLADLASMNFAGAGKEFAAAGNAAMASWQGVGQAVKGVGAMFNEVFHGQGAFDRGHGIVNQAIYEHNQRVNRLLGEGLDDDKTVGMGGPGGRTAHPRHAHPRVAHPRAGSTTETTFEYVPDPNEIKDIDGFAQAQKALDDVLKDLGTTTEDLAKKHDLLTAAIAQEQQRDKDLHEQQVQAIEAYSEARDAANAYGASLSRQPTQQQLDYLALLEQREKAAKVAMDDVNASLNQNTHFLDQNQAALKRNTQEQQKAADEIEKAHKKALEEMEKAYQKWYDQATKKTAGFLDDIIIKHKSLKDELKTIYDDIAKSFIDMVAKMIVESNLFKGIFGNLAPGGGGFGPGGTAPFGGGGGGLLSLLGLAGGGGAAASARGAVEAGAAGKAIDVNVAATGGTKVGSDGSVPTNIAAVAGKGIASIVGGAAVGGMVASLTGGNGIGGMAGGALGSLIGVALHANPLIGAGIEAVSALAGGMIGPHWGPASNYPDRSDPTYKAWLDAYNDGNPNDIAFQIEAKLKSMDPSSLSGQSLADYNALKNLAGSNGDLGIAREHDGTFTFGSGQTDSVVDFRALVDRFQGESGGANGPIPTFSISRSYPDFNAAHMSATGTIPGTGASTVHPGVTIMPGAIVVNGNVVGNDGMNQLATTIGQRIAQQQRGFAPMGGRVTLSARTGGGF